MKLIDPKNTNIQELMVLLTCRLLPITKHSKSFVFEQKQLIQKMIMSPDVKDACIEALDSIEIEEA